MVEGAGDEAEEGVVEGVLVGERNASDSKSEELEPVASVAHGVVIVVL